MSSCLPSDVVDQPRFTELVSCQPGFKYSSAPLDVRLPEVRKYSGLQGWANLYLEGSEEKYERYFSGLMNGTIKIRNPNPLQSHFRILTNCVVFKVIHDGVDRINWFRDQFNGRIMLARRHPIAVSISRVEYPFMHHFLGGKFIYRFTSEQRSRANKIIKMGSKLERGVLAWCIRHAIPLQEAEDDLAIVTYEQTVLDPHPLIEYLCGKLQHPVPDKIIQQLNAPSSVIKKSDNETQDLLKETGARSRKYELVNKWQ